MSGQALLMMIVVLCLTWGLFASLVVWAARCERKKSSPGEAAGPGCRRFPSDS